MLRKMIEFGLDEASLQQLLILCGHSDKEFARYAVEQKLCVEDRKPEPLEIQFLVNPSWENTAKLREHYLKLLEEKGASPYIELGKEWRRLPDLADDTTTTETTEDIVYLALTGI